MESEPNEQVEVKLTRAGKPMSWRGQNGLKHLSPWKPGQTGNPNGRPRKKPITDRYREAIEEELPDEDREALGLPRGATIGDAIAKKMARRAAFDEVRAVESAREIRESIEGRAPQSIDVNEARDIQIHVSYENLTNSGDGNTIIDDEDGTKLRNS